MRQMHLLPCKSLLYVMLLLVSVLGGVIWYEWQQEKLDRALVSEVKENNTKKILFLLDAGADPNTRDISTNKIITWTLYLNIWRKTSSVTTGSSVLILAINQHSGYNRFLPETLHIVKALISKGADVNAVNPSGETPLLLLFKSHSVPNSSIAIVPEENIDLVKLLLNAGANTECRDGSGETALMFAAEYGFKESVLLLLSKGANINAIANRSFPGTALSLAKAMNNEDIVKILLSHGANK